MATKSFSVTHPDGLHTRPIDHKYINQAAKMGDAAVAEMWEIKPGKFTDLIRQNLLYVLESKRGMLLGTFDGRKLVAVSAILPYPESVVPLEPLAIGKIGPNNIAYRGVMAVHPDYRGRRITPVHDELRFRFARANGFTHMLSTTSATSATGTPLPTNEYFRKNPEWTLAFQDHYDGEPKVPRNWWLGDLSKTKKGLPNEQK